MPDELTPGHQRADPTSITADLEANLEHKRVKRAEALSAAEIERAARLAAWKVIQDDAATAERLRLASDAAHQAGILEARMTMRIEDLEGWRKMVNGSIERGARAAEALGRKVDGIIEHQRLRDAREQERDAERAKVEQKRVEQLRIANEGSISARMFKLGVAAIAVPLLGSIAVEVLKAVHVL